MERLVIKAIIKMCVKAISLAVVIGVVIVIVGYINKWNSPIAYSNAFFLAGCLVIVAGTAARLGAGRELSNTPLIHAESFREMSNIERASFIIDTNSPVSLVILGVLTGILLMLISAIAAFLS